MPWGAVIGAVGSIAAGAMASSAADSNSAAAQNTAANELAASAPYNMPSGPFGQAYFDSSGSGNEVTQASLSPQYQTLERGLLGSAGGWLGGLNNLGENGGFTPFLANAYSQYRNSMPSAVPFNFGSLAGQAFGGNLGTAQNFSNSANGLLGQLTQFNPATAGQNYTNLLASQSAPANALAAQNLTQQLFNSGALGSTGGSQALGALNQGQAQQYVAQQLAGQQLGLQQQGLLGSLASGFGGLGNSMNATNYGMGSSLAGTLFGNQYQLGQQGLQNAIGLNQAGNQNLGAYAGLTQGLLGGGMSIDNALLNQILASSQMGAARTGAAISAGNTSLQGQLAANNTGAMGMIGAINGLSGANWAGLFSPSNTTSPYAGNMNMVPSLS